MTDERTPFGGMSEGQSNQGFGSQSMGQIAQTPADEPRMQQMQQAEMAGAARCPNCGAPNDPMAAYCEVCGAALRVGTCPNCGSQLDDDADFCEICHHYVRQDVCSFCGAQLLPQDAFCPDCGSPRGGIACPTCHTLNDFAFCKQCGTPLTDEARQLIAQLKMQPDYRELVAVAHEFNELSMQVPISSEKDEERFAAGQELRERVLRLLAQDEGDPNPVIPQPKKKHLTKEELDQKKNKALDKLTELLDRMALPPMISPAKVRNFAMAQKPSGVRLAWVCNWKHAMHSSPCGCAKPQMGGKWVVLGHNSNQEIKDDK